MKNVLKKTMAALLCAILAILVAPVLSSASAAALDYDEFDAVFLQTAEETIPDFYLGEVRLSANKEVLYDLDLNKLGFIYDFTVDGQDGYATVVNIDGYPELSGIFFDSTCPFDSVNAVNYYRVYVSGCTYLYYYDGAFYSLSDSELSAEAVSALREKAYISAEPTRTGSNEYVYYLTKTILASNELAQRYPLINGIVGHVNCCAPIAGANIIQFWDRYKPDLIPNFEPGITYYNLYLYKTSEDELDDMAEDLYVAMQTNIGGPGTTISECLSGLSSYVTAAGYTFSYESCMTNSVFNYTVAKQKIDDIKPLLLFVDGFSVADITQYTGYDYIGYSDESGAHAMAGFGYKTIYYTFSDNTTRTDNYIGVSSGMHQIGKGYFNISRNTQIDNAYAINIT